MTVDVNKEMIDQRGWFDSHNQTQVNVEKIIKILTVFYVSNIDLPSLDFTAPQPQGISPMKITFSLLLLSLSLFLPTFAKAELKAGATVVDVTPSQFPVLINGSMVSHNASTVKTKVNARAIVLDDGHERLAIVVVDSCMMPRPLLDDVKKLAAQRTKIKTNHMLISATHTPSAPSSLACLGTDADPNYVPFLRNALVEAIIKAEKNLEPAKVGWGVGNAAKYTALRRWIRRPDRIIADPFGNLTCRAQMHSGRIWDDAIGESGPEDPDLSMISFQSTTGRPIALLANFSMHYFGDKAISADYFGLFSEGLKSKIAGKEDSNHPPFVGIMSHGCSGDIWRRDYTERDWSKPPKKKVAPATIDNFTAGLLKIAMKTYQTIEYREESDIAMAETRMTLNYRVPNKERLEWAQKIVKEMGDRLPKTREEIYAREAIILDERQETEIVVQALRVGDICIASTPCETYALTGLKLKLQSPLSKTMVIELANGGDGYIPPPEQHHLGGYNTWPARSAGLEVQAEPKIVEALLQLLEQVAQKPRKPYVQSKGSASTAIANAKPVAWWRLDEFGGSRAVDSSGNNRDAQYEKGVAFFLAGPQSKQFCKEGETNRSVHFAGGRLRTRVAGLGDQYSVSLWFWNGMPNDARKTTGWIFSRDRDNGLGTTGDHLGIGGTATESGKLIFSHGNDSKKPIVGKSTIKRWDWNHVLFVRDGDKVTVYLNGNKQPEFEVNSPAKFPTNFDRLFFGGRSDNQSNWEGRLDEIAVFDRVMKPIK